MDIRKPKILKGLGMHERKGITNFLVADFNIEEIIHQVPGVENMYVIPCGPVPPNPAEMLLDEKMVDLFAILRKKFDAIIIDSAPVGLVSDAMTLSEHANATVFIVRHYYTYKKQIELIDELYRNNKLPHLSIAINDIQTKGGYGSYYGYGYGYGDRANVYYQGMSKRSLLQRVIISIINKTNK
jgi:tyrosine-protein kinase Etk/Wzc